MKTIEIDLPPKPTAGFFKTLAKGIPGLSFGYIGNGNDRTYYITTTFDSVRAPRGISSTLWSCHLRDFSRAEYSKASRSVKAYRLGLEAARQLDTQSN